MPEENGGWHKRENRDCLKRSAAETCLHPLSETQETDADVCTGKRSKRGYTNRKDLVFLHNPIDKSKHWARWHSADCK